MTGMALRGEDYRCARFVHGFDGFLVAHRATRLDDRSDTRIEQAPWMIRELGCSDHIRGYLVLQLPRIEKVHLTRRLSYKKII
jgi:hypothetical protein